MDWLTKFFSLLPCDFGLDHPFSVGGAADLLVHHFFCKYDVSWSIVYDQDVQFTADLWYYIRKLLGTRLLLSTEYPPQMDGQTKHTNRSIG